MIPLKQELEADSDILFASFSGLPGKIDFLPFDFVRATARYPINGKRCP